METYDCTGEKCNTRGLAQVMSVPSDEELLKLHGKRPSIAELRQYVLCTYCTQKRRKDGLKSFGLLVAITRERQRIARRDARSNPRRNHKGDNKGQPAPLITRERNGRNVGTGLKACATLDARTRQNTKKQTS